MSNYLIGVDVGSGSARAGVFDEYGKRLGMAVYPILQFRPKTDHVEQSSTDIWKSVCNAVRDAVSESKIDVKEVSGIGFDATCSLVALDSDNQPTTVSSSNNNRQNIIMWMDHRAIEEANEINSTKDDALKYVGGEVSPEMELPKILWLKKYLPEKYENISKFFDLADFLVFKASGKSVRSVCTKSCKWNYLSHENRWAHSLLEKMNLTDIIDDGKIDGTIEDLGSFVGKLTNEAASELGLTTHTSVSTGIIDAHAGGLAIIGDEPESTLAVIGGTSSCHMTVTKKETFVPGVWGPYWGAMLPDYWLLEGGQSAAGALIDHVIRGSSEYHSLRQRAEIEKRSVYEILNQKVAELEQDNSKLMQNFHMLGYHHGNRSPRANPTLKGMITGLSLDESLDALAIEYLAAIQSVAYGTRHIIEAMRQNGHDITKITMCGGGTKNPLWLREHADITGCDVVLPSEPEAVILGAAMLGATASGVHKSLAEAAKIMGSTGEKIEPNRERKTFHDAKYKVFLEMYQDQMKYKTMMENI
ncbi:ribulokinase [Vibrio sp. MACH09]|uniref:FGGY-family carbohydrate kinase n=1 Tax=Vibrio sp. MACH09 TaxID=3025122 RepID=UPI00278CD05D|nr:FGGY-family carbohydrate kinase [Vibrio sp. MACH09]GLO63735.1 ribulokinase [Vibrio sp. MACH09]